MKQKLMVLMVAMALASGCAAGRAFRKGEEAARNGNWDAAVAQYTKAVQEAPDKAEYKIVLERAMRTAAQNHISLAREFEEKDQLDAALIEYKRAVDLDATNRLAAAKMVELEKVVRDRIEATRPRPQIDKLREQARTMGQPIIN